MNQKLASLLETVVQEGASDLHVAVGRQPFVRVTGELTSLVQESPTTDEEMKIFLTEFAGEKRFNKFLETQELDFSYDFNGKARLRGNAYYHQGEIAVALRVLQTVKSLDELNLPKVLENFARLKQGFFLIVGPVGQGKTTTMAALLELINSERAEHILTIEDPIEYLFEPKRSIIDQREIGLDTEDFSTALRSAFRQDANVLMVGEMRGPETMAAAVTAAETGHLVFSLFIQTMHHKQ
mgnify:CR=1 FL=1